MYILLRNILNADNDTSSASEIRVAGLIRKIVETC